MKRFFLLSLLSITVSACTGGTVGGLLPAPKVLAGDIEGDMYVSKYGAFKVKLPHPPSASSEDSYEWKYTKVREVDQVKDSGDRTVVGAIFGPAAFDLNIYHAVLIQAPMKHPKRDYARQVFEKKVQSRDADLTELHFEVFQLNGRTIYYGVYEGTSQHLILSLADNGNSFFAIEADIDPNSRKSGLASLENAIDREWERFNNMLSSFTVLKEQI